MAQDIVKFILRVIKFEMRRKFMSTMKKLSSRLLALFLFIGLTIGSMPAIAEDRTALEDDVHAAIKLLLDTTPAAKELAKTAKGALVFPNVVKAGFLVGVKYGDGALVRASKIGGYYIVDYYNISALSVGMHAGVQSFGYVMALMTDAALENVETSEGWELGVGPTIVVLDAGMAKTFSTETAKSDVYAFTFGQKGLMAGMSIKGTKITKLD
jgi:lipid-binding SYLF domain-containing protein